MTTDLTIQELKKTDPIPYHLLLLADPSKIAIDKYIYKSVIYTAECEGKCIGCYVLYPLNQETLEIKNIVIAEEKQGKGIGTILLNHAIGQAKLMGGKRIRIGTGNSSIGQLYLYQKVGFRITAIKMDFFRDNYKDVIIENGIECRDMIVLTKEL